MENGAFKLLESATHRTLHAQNFARSSSQASLVLTDLLSRYLYLLVSTCAKYSSHAGRANISARDALSSLEEMGISLDELSDYCMTEGRELARYAPHTARRMEDLHDFRVALAHGSRTDRDDVIPLSYRLLDNAEELFLSSDDEDGAQDEALGDSTMASPEGVLDDFGIIFKPARIHTPPRQRSPPLPPSPVSNPVSPARKRLRTEPWHSPPNIPDFLPPIPRIVDPSEDFHRSPSPIPHSAVSVTQHPATKAEKPPTASSLVPPTAPVALQHSTATSASDYKTPIPYTQSTLSAIPEWHLPPATPPPVVLSQNGGVNARESLPTPRTQPSLIGAYHHILTHPPSKDIVPTPNPQRHRVALGLLGLQETSPRWDPPDTVFAGSMPPTPRFTGVMPTFAIAVGDVPSTLKDDSKGVNGDTGPKVMPSAPPRPLTANERLAPSIVQHGSRIPDLSRTLLPNTLYKRTTRLGHPPVLQRGTQKLVYGPPINAPWNTSLQPTTFTPGTANGTVPPHHLINGSNKSESSSDRKLGGDGIRDAVASGQRLPDARLHATWDYEQKSYRDSLTASRAFKAKGAQVQIAGVNNSSSAIDAVPSRKGSMISLPAGNGIETSVERKGTVFTLPARRDSTQVPIPNNGRTDNIG